MSETTRRVTIGSDGKPQGMIRPSEVPQYTAEELLQAKKGLLQRDFNNLAQEVEVELARDDVELTGSRSASRMDVPLDDQTRNTISNLALDLEFNKSAAYRSLETDLERRAFRELVRDGEIKTGVTLKATFTDSVGEMADFTSNEATVGQRGVTTFLDKPQLDSLQNSSGFTLKITP